MVKMQLSSEAIKKVAFPQFEENQKKPEAVFFVQFPRRQLEIVFPQFEENQKKPEGCF
jgi:hypothetical protein